VDPIFISIAFVLGFLVRQLSLPPLIGFLAAGFALQAFGFEGGETLHSMADLGVTLLLFSIGLKLNLKSLIKAEIWGTASIHMIAITSVFCLIIYGFSIAGLSYFSQLNLQTVLLVAFALSFSSTVFAVKILEEKGEMYSMHGKVSIGILIMQDIFAVVFLTLSLGKFPSLWALLIPIALILLRPILFLIADKCGHGELLLLFSLFVALVVGAYCFELVGMKSDLGALVLGVLMSGHDKSSEIAKTLLGLKDLFLIGFFLTIGFYGAPSLTALGVSFILVTLIFLKFWLFFVVLTRFKLRSRSSLLGSLSLANYSEFGLIVAAVGTNNGWISPEWMVIIAVALAISFVIASPLNTFGDAIYLKYRHFLRRFETDCRHHDDQPIDPGNAKVCIFGMGRIGTAAYDYMSQNYTDEIIGFDFNQMAVAQHQSSGRHVLYGDPTDPDFWSRMDRDSSKELRLIMLALPKHVSNLTVAKKIMSKRFSGTVSAVATFDDQVDELKEVGVHAAYNMYNEAGLGFAEHVLSSLKEETSYPSSS
jgi:predicted Kef-type K+ transport protein